MSNARRRGSGKPLVWLCLTALAIVAIGLSVVALWPDPVPDAGQDVPVLVPPTSVAPIAPSSTGDPVQSTQLRPIDRFIAPLDSTSAIRATQGACAGPPATVEITNNGGATWSPITFETTEAPRVILAVNAISADQIDVAVLSGPDCASNLLTSYTGGQFWEQYPERLGELSYFDPANASIVYASGEQVPAPCPNPIQVSTVEGTAIMLCAGQIFRYSSVLGTWETFIETNAIGLSPNQVDTAGQSEVVVAEDGDESCDGTLLIAYSAMTVAGARTVGCAPLVADAGSSVAVGAGGQSIWLWAASGIVHSSDGGITWR